MDMLCKSNNFMRIYRVRVCCGIINISLWRLDISDNKRKRVFINIFAGKKVFTNILIYHVDVSPVNCPSFKIFNTV